VTHAFAAVDPSLPRYHRVESPTQTSAVAWQQVETGVLRGTVNRWMALPSVDAWEGPLPEGVRGIEFQTDVPPDPGRPPGRARWTGPRDGVSIDGDWAEIEVTIVWCAQ
jgi:hypothetical protein